VAVAAVRRVDDRFQLGPALVERFAQHESDGVAADLRDLGVRRPKRRRMIALQIGERLSLALRRRAKDDALRRRRAAVDERRAGRTDRKVERRDGAPRHGVAAVEPDRARAGRGQRVGKPPRGVLAVGDIEPHQRVGRKQRAVGDERHGDGAVGVANRGAAGSRAHQPRA
jgi:hypothetical protein